MTCMKMKTSPLSLFFIFSIFSSEAFYSKAVSPFPQLPPESELDLLLTLDSGQRWLISSIYDRISSLTPSPTDSLKLYGKQDLGIDVSDQ